MVRHINDHEPDAVVPALSSEQFDELKALLLPGYELSSLMLEDYKVRQAEAKALQAKEVAAANEAIERGKASGGGQVVVATDVDAKPGSDDSAHD